MRRPQEIRGLRVDPVSFHGEPRLVLAVSLRNKMVGYRVMTEVQVRDLIELLERGLEGAAIETEIEARSLKLYLPQLATLFALGRRAHRCREVPAEVGTRGL